MSSSPSNSFSNELLRLISSAQAIEYIECNVCVWIFNRIISKRTKSVGSSGVLPRQTYGQKPPIFIHVNIVGSIRQTQSLGCSWPQLCVSHLPRPPLHADVHARLAHPFVPNVTHPERWQPVAADAASCQCQRRHLLHDSVGWRRRIGCLGWC